MTSTADLLLSQARRSPQRTAMVLRDGSRTTYTELAHRAWSVAAFLSGRDLDRGTTVGLLFPEGRWAEYAAGYFGTLLAGCAAIVLPTDTDQGTLRHICEETAVAVVLCVEKPAELTGVVPMVRLDELPDEQPPSRSESFDPGALGDVIFTSGSSGVPKGVAASRGAMLDLARRYAARPGGARVLGHGLSHATAVGTRQILLSAVARGATIVTCTPFEADRFLEMAIEEGIETAVLPAAVGTSLLRSLDSGAAPRPHRLRRLRFISDALNPGVHRELADRLPNCRVINSYGLTEGGDAHLVVTQDDCHLGPGGYPAPGTEARIVSEEGKWLGPDAEGYICLRDAQAPLTYLAHPDQATATWRDGWTVTGDRGVMAADGRIRFTGRNESLARVGGKTVSLPQVQGFLERHPAVTSAAVLAVEHPRLGQVLAAVVESPASTGALKMRQFLREWLPEHAVPAITVPTVALPRLRTGKPNPEAIRTLVRAHLDAEPRDCLPGTQSVLAAVWERVLRPGRRVGPDDEFFELGGDSMAAVEVMVCLEGELGVEIPVDVMFAASNLAELAAELDRLVRRP